MLLAVPCDKRVASCLGETVSSEEVLSAILGHWVGGIGELVGKKEKGSKKGNGCCGKGRQIKVMGE